MTIGDVQYPRNIFVLWSKEELAAIGIKPYSEVHPDSRYYSDGALTRTETDGEMVGTYAAVAKDVDALKDNMLAQSNQSLAHYKAKWIGIGLGQLKGAQQYQQT